MRVSLRDVICQDLINFLYQTSARNALPATSARLRAANASAGRGSSVAKRMQNHAPYACMAFIRKNCGIFGVFKRTTEAEPDWGIRARSYWCCYHCHFEQNKSG